MDVPDKNSVPPIELHIGFFWDCEMCGRENWQRSCSPSLTDNEEKYLRDAYAQVGVGRQTYVLAPTEVKCKHCGEEYESYMTSPVERPE